MVGILGKAPLASDVAFFLEILVIILLFLARYEFAGRGRIRKHGYTMAVATSVHAISVLLVMIPSLARSLDFVIGEFFSPIIIITLIHIPTGSVTLVLGSYLVIKWGYRRSERTCYKSGGLMKPLWLLWLFSLALGFLIYVVIAWFS